MLNNQWTMVYSFEANEWSAYVNVLSVDSWEAFLLAKSEILAEIEHRKELMASCQVGSLSA